MANNNRIAMLERAARLSREYLAHNAHGCENEVHAVLTMTLQALDDKIVECHRCGETPDFNGHGSYGNALCCRNCYDGAEDAGSVRHEYVDCMMPDASREAWNEMMCNEAEEKLPPLPTGKVAA